MIAPYGPTGLLVQCEDTDHAHRLLRNLRNQPQWSRVLCGIDTVTVEWDTAMSHDEAARHVTNSTSVADRSAPGKHVTVPVIYDGEDLTTIADTTGMSITQIIETHTGPTYTVALVGFAPGFPYLTGGDTRLALPRIATPRTRVPAGSVGVAGDMTCIYPRTSPGGWNLLGHTTTELFNPLWDQPSLLHPGDTLNFMEAS